MIRLWSNFAKYGNPNGAGDTAAGEPVWPEYAAPHWRHLVVNDRDLKVMGEGVVKVSNWFYEA